MVSQRCFENILDTLAKDLEERGKPDLLECFIDGTYVSVKKGARVGRTKRSKGSKVMAIADRAGLEAYRHSRMEGYTA